MGPGTKRKRTTQNLRHPFCVKSELKSAFTERRAPRLNLAFDSQKFSNNGNGDLLGTLSFDGKSYGAKNAFEALGSYAFFLKCLKDLRLFFLAPDHANVAGRALQNLLKARLIIGMTARHNGHKVSGADGKFLTQTRECRQHATMSGHGETLGIGKFFAVIDNIHHKSAGMGRLATSKAT